MLLALFDCLVLAVALVAAAVIELAIQLLVTFRQIKNIALSFLE